MNTNYSPNISFMHKQRGLQEGSNQDQKYDGFGLQLDKDKTQWSEDEEGTGIYSQEKIVTTQKMTSGFKNLELLLNRKNEVSLDNNLSRSGKVTLNHFKICFFFLCFLWRNRLFLGPLRTTLINLQSNHIIFLKKRKVFKRYCQFLLLYNKEKIAIK